MKKIAGWLAVVTLLSGMAAAEARKSNFDFSAVEQVWKIAGILERDKEPDAAEWTSLFQTAGYRELMRREPFFRKENFKDYLRQAFMPSQAAARKEALEKSPNSTWAHFARIKDRRDDLRRLQADLERGTMMDEALAKTRTLLPERAMDGESYPPVAFIFFAPDGRGYVPILIDFLYAADKADSLVDFLAHEAHHYYRNRIRAYDEGNVKVIHQGLLNGLDQLQIEGVADQIDKHESFFRKANPESSNYAESFRKNVAESPRILAEVNRRLEAAADSPESASSLMGILPQSGHPTGYYMARAIIAQGGEPEMIKTIGNPFAFIYLYNRAALKSGRYPAFSRKAVEFLRSLEKDYCREPETALFREAAPGGFDASAVVAFWEIADQLAHGLDPSEAEWVRLLGHPAYAILKDREGDDYAAAGLKDRMELVFESSRSEELQSKLKQGADGRTRHFAEIKPKRAEIDAYLTKLGTGDWMSRVMAEVLPLLPSGIIETKAEPAFAAVIFSPDLRFGYPILIFDPLYGAGHEASVEYYARRFVLNYYRDSRLAYDPARLKIKHAEAIDLFEAMEIQGFMEHIYPKNEAFDGDPARKDADQKAFEAALAQAPAFIERLDQTLAEIGKTPEKTEAWSKLSAINLPLEGRPVGFFMAKAIIDRLEKSRLAAVLGNPFGFIRLYNEAAAQGAVRLPEFGKPALRLIAGLEKEYGRAEIR